MKFCMLLKRDIKHFRVVIYVSGSIHFSRRQKSRHLRQVTFASKEREGERETEEWKERKKKENDKTRDGYG